MKKYARNVKRMCGHYREQISECRNCDPSDAPYKECYLRRMTGGKYPLKSKNYWS